MGKKKETEAEEKGNPCEGLGHTPCPADKEAKRVGKTTQVPRGGNGMSNLGKGGKYKDTHSGSKVSMQERGEPHGKK